MATIQYTTYTFHKPQIISEEEYDKIKVSLNQFSAYNPFPAPGIFQRYYQEFKLGVKFFFISGPIAGVLASTGIEILEIIGGIWAFLAFGAFFGGGIQSSFSFLGFCFKKKGYYSRLLKKIKVSDNYNDFIVLMS